MKIITGACATLLVLSLATACSSSGGDASTGSPTAQAAAPANNGVGTWTTTTESGTVASVKIPATAADDPVIAEVEKCRVAMKADEATLVVLSLDATKSADSADTTSGTIVTADGTAVDIESAVAQVGEWYSDKPESASRAACVETNQKLEDSQGLVPAGAKGTAVFAAKSPVTSAKSVSLNILGGPTPLTYSGS